MLQLAWPWALAALALPWLVRRLAPPGGVLAGEALRYPGFAALRTYPGAGGRAGSSLARAGALLAWGLLVLAASRPQAVGEPLSIPLTGRDLVLAVDLSTSMQVPDMVVGGTPASRLAAVKALGGAFIERRVGDRIGLVVFASRPYVQVPLTFDRRTTRRLLEEAVVGLAGDRTALGDAIALGVERLRRHAAEAPDAARVLVLMSDGASTAGTLGGLEAARLAAAAGVRIHAVGVGTAIDPGRQRAMGSRDLGLSLAEDDLRAIAAATGGEYLRADSTGALAAVYERIDALEPAARAADVVRPVREVYHWPLAAALLLGAATVLATWSRSTS